MEFSWVNPRFLWGTTKTTMATARWTSSSTASPCPKGPWSLMICILDRLDVGVGTQRWWPFGIPRDTKKLESHRKTMGKPLENGDVIGINPTVSGWWFGTCFMTSPTRLGMMIQSDELIFVRGVGQPPTSIYLRLREKKRFFSERWWSNQLKSETHLAAPARWRHALDEDFSEWKLHETAKLKYEQKFHGWNTLERKRWTSTT